MKKILIVAVSVLVVAALISGASIALAAKPQDVIYRSNGFPSGLHFNLNIHGKDPAVFDCESMDPGGNSIFVPIEGSANITYVANKGRKNNFSDGASAYELNVLDPCAVGGDNTAQVYLPTKVWDDANDDGIMDDNELVDAEGFYVFARILGKPENKQSEYGHSTMILEPNIVVQACNDPGTDIDPNFPDYTECLISLGLIVGNDLYIPNDETFERFDPAVTKGKGKSMARDISPLFNYTGYVYWGEDPDTNDDGFLTVADIGALADYPGADFDSSGTIELCEWVLFHPDINGDFSVTEADANLAEYWLTCVTCTTCYTVVIPDTNSNPADITLKEWSMFQESLGHAEYFDDEWIFNIMDLVVTSQGIYNDGAKLVQIRFYPKNPDLTTYNP